MVHESRCPIVPGPAFPPQSEDVYASTPEQVVAPLRGAIAAALCAPETTNRSTLLDAADALDESLESARDVMPLGRVRVLLEKAREPDEPAFRAVLQTLASTERAYHFNEVVPERPTLFLVHGSDRGPFDTFAPYFEAFAKTHNVVFVLYDSFRTTARKAAWLADRIREWRASGEASGALHVVAWSDGATVLRKAVLDDEEGLFRGARIVNLAPPLAGSYRARWVDDGPMRLIAFPALLYLVRNSYLIDMAEDYNPYGELMAEMYGRRTNELVAEHLGGGSELNVVVEGDPHAPQAPLVGFLEPGFDAYAARYEASLGANHVRLPARSENPHQDVTRDPDAIRAVVRHLTGGPAPAEVRPASRERDGRPAKSASSARKARAKAERASLDRNVPREPRKTPSTARAATRRHHGRS
jgi:hypothetical protein